MVTYTYVHLDILYVRTKQYRWCRRNFFGFFFFFLSKTHRITWMFSDSARNSGGCTDFGVKFFSCEHFFRIASNVHIDCQSNWIWFFSLTIQDQKSQQFSKSASNCLKLSYAVRTDEICCFFFYQNFNEFWRFLNEI